MFEVGKEFVYPSLAASSAAIAAYFDVKSRRIPNALTAPVLLGALLLHTYLDGWHGFLNSMSAGLLCGCIFLIFYIAGGMGAGDVKLIAAVGAMAGLSNATYLLVLTSLAGGAMGLGMAALRGKLRETLGNVGALAAHHGQSGLTPHPQINVLNSSKLRLPYALAIAAGSSATLLILETQR